MVRKGSVSIPRQPLWLLQQHVLLLPHLAQALIFNYTS